MGVGGPFQEKPGIRVDELVIARGARTLFEGLSFSASAGAFVEIRGANGSGKTSLLRAIAGFLPPRAGRIVIEGGAEAALALHYLGHGNGLKPSLSVISHQRYWAALLGGEQVGGLASQLGLDDLRDLPARALSQGQARRLALARLLLAPRPIWLLDEPAAGLDLRARAVLATMIEAQRAKGGLVLAAVHEPLGPVASQTIRLSAPA